MTGRVQMRGACPACGRLQAINAGGRLADHGYVVRGYSHWNECPGSRVPHFGIEAGRDWLASTVVSWESRAESLQLQLREAVDDKSRREMQRRIGGLRAAAVDARKRLATWQPVAPVEVRIAEKPVVVHLAAKVYGHSGALCCASAMGALRFRGQRTTVESEVTCPRCLKRLEARRAMKGGGA